MEDSSESYNATVDAIKNTKSQFGKIIKFINQNQEIYNQLTSEMKTNLKQLIQLWNNNAGANIEYYFKMKEHHSYINGQITNETLKTMWDDYIKSGLELRLRAMRLNY